MKIITNQTYLKSDIMYQMQDYFEKEIFIQLQDYLDIDSNKLIQDLGDLKFTQIFNPMKYKFSEVNLIDLNKNKSENYLSKISTYFQSKEFIDFLNNLTQSDLKLSKIVLRKYSQSDFTILNDEEIRGDSIDVYFDLSDYWNVENGGRVTYTTKEEELFYLEPTYNTLTILFKSEDVVNYLKYINCLAKNKSIIRFELKFDFIK